MTSLAISQIKIGNCDTFLKYILLLSGDIETNPGPIQYPCPICQKPVRKRILYCNRCGFWIHKKCEQISITEYKKFKITPGENSQYTCRSCHACRNENDDTNGFSWDHLPFLLELPNDQIEETEILNISTLSYTNNWEIFNKRGLHFIHLNINSILSKIDELRLIAQNSKATIIGISESKIDETVLDGEIDIEGFKLERSDRNRQGGGVVCYISKEITYNVRDKFSSNIENIFLDILLPKTKPILIGILYRPPKQSGFLHKLTTAISNTNNFEQQEVYILGDININLIPNGTHAPNGIKMYREFCATHDLKQIITSPTRITEKSSTLLDHILTNSSDRVSQSGVIDLGLSDHQLIYCTRKIIKNKPNKHKFIKIRSLKHYTIEKFLKELKDIIFPDYSDYNDINEAYSDFIKKITKIIDKIAPIKEIRIKNNTAKWIDEEILEGIRNRDKLFTKFKKSKINIDHLNYKKARNKLQSMIKRKKKNFILEELNSNIEKPKELWKSIKSLGLPTKSDTCNICLENKNNNISFDSKTNAEIFKDFFSKLANDLVEKLPVPTNKFGIDCIKNYYKNLNLEENCFILKPTNEVVILKLLEDINPSKAAGLDNLSGKFLRDGATLLAEPITKLCNLSIELATFPDDCKIAKLKPLFKKGSKIDPQNYRPISLLPLISKIIEKVIHNQSQEYLDKHNILYKYQSGFRKNHSADTCLSYLNDKIIQGFDKGLLTGMILIDLQKAFDTINHRLFLEKLSVLGFHTSTIAWYKSYLENRTFSVNVDSKYSSHGTLTCGVPQGSILGPLIFLLYVNDMSQAVDCDLLLYADDTGLTFMGKDKKTIEENLHRNFNSLCDWFVENKLSIHLGEDKTKSILFGTRRQLKNIGELNIRLGDIDIKHHSNVKYLGVILDNNLSGETMASKVLGKINGRLKFLYRKQHFLNSSLRRLLANALIQPHFDYACSAWYANLNKGLTKKIQTTQNKCIRFCLGLGNRTHLGTKEFEKINWLPTKERFEQMVSVNIYKFFNNDAPAYMKEIFHPVDMIHNTRRSKHRLILPHRKNNRGQKSLSFTGPKIWNNLYSELKTIGNVNTFKHKIKNTFFISLKKREENPYEYY